MQVDKIASFSTAGTEINMEYTAVNSHMMINYGSFLHNKDTILSLTTGAILIGSTLVRMEDLDSTLDLSIEINYGTSLKKETTTLSRVWIQESTFTLAAPEMKLEFTMEATVISSLFS